MNGGGERRLFWRTALLVLMVAAATSVQSRGQRATNCGLTCYRSWGISLWYEICQVLAGKSGK
jgi:hypothetical protein